MYCSFFRLLDCVHCIVLYIYFMLPFGAINWEWWIVSVTVMWYVGIPDDRDGLFDTILLSKNQYQKRAYQCIKMMVSLFTLYACCFSAILLAEYLLFNLHSFTAVFLHCWLYVASIMASQASQNLGIYPFSPVCSVMNCPALSEIYCI